MIRQAFVCVLDQEPDLEVVAQAGSLAEGRARVAAGGVNVAPVDLALPDVNGADLVHELREAAPLVPVLVLTPTFDPARHAWALEAGAAEVLSKAATVQEILAAIRRLAR